MLQREQSKQVKLANTKTVVLSCTCHQLCYCSSPSTSFIIHTVIIFFIFIHPSLSRYILSSGRGCAHLSMFLSSSFTKMCIFQRASLYSSLNVSVLFIYVCVGACLNVHFCHVWQTQTIKSFMFPDQTWCNNLLVLFQFFLALGSSAYSEYYWSRIHTLNRSEFVITHSMFCQQG